MSELDLIFDQFIFYLKHRRKMHLSDADKAPNAQERHWDLIKANAVQQCIAGVRAMKKHHRFELKNARKMAQAGEHPEQEAFEAIEKGKL